MKVKEVEKAVVSLLGSLGDHVDKFECTFERVQAYGPGRWRGRVYFTMAPQTENFSLIIDCKSAIDTGKACSRHSHE